MSEVLVALRAVTKVYPGTIAAEEITVEFRSGEIHGLVGENGAGKSTLVKILAGLIQPNCGHVEIRGQARRLANPRASLLEGIGVVHQTGSLIRTLTVRENLELGKLYSPRTKVQTDLQREGLALSPDIPLSRRVNTLSPRQCQLVEIHRLMLQNAELLILDEPTATLTPQESALLFSDLERLAKAGYGVVVISHKLRELVSHCHTFTVLRRGRVVGRLDRGNASVAELVRLCGGAATSDPALTPTRKPSRPDLTKALVQLKGVTTAPSTNEPLYDINLALHPGEIVGVAGRPGSGAATLLKLLRTGPVALSRGTVEWNTAGRFADRAVGYVPCDRIDRGVILDLTIAENLQLRHRNFLGRIGTHDHRSLGRKFVESHITEFDIRPPQPNAKLSTLSGGNIQKVLLAREMEHAQLLLVVESPSAGLDIGSAAFVRQRLRQKADNGSCVVVHSDDLDELVESSDRVLIMAEGRCTGELVGAEVTAASVGLALSSVGFMSQSLAESTLMGWGVSCAD